jgi:hypothetical protein
MKSKTYTAGANAERSAIISKLRRLMPKGEAAQKSPFWELYTWVLSRDSRYNKRPGGLGK